MGWMTDVTDAVGITDSAGAAQAATDAERALVQSAQQGIQGFEQAREQYVDPYFQSGLGGLGRAEDLILGRKMQYTPQEQMLLDEAMERVNRESAYTGGLGGGQRLKRLQQTALGTMDAIRQREIGNNMQFAQLGQNAAQMGMGSQAGIADLQTGIGSAQASGIMGRRQAENMGTGLIMTGLGAGIGSLGGAEGAKIGAQTGSIMGDVS